MRPLLRKIIALPILFIVLMVMLAPHIAEAELMVVQEHGCCAHGNNTSTPEGADPVADCPLCSILSIDLPSLLLLKNHHTEVPILGGGPGTLTLVQFPSGIDWPPEPI